MLDGIKFYPKKKKRIKFKILILLIILAVAYIVWIFVDNMGKNLSEESVLIVIIKPLDEPEVIEMVVENTEKISVEVESNNNENLDEVIQAYEASSHD